MINDAITCVARTYLDLWLARVFQVETQPFFHGLVMSAKQNMYAKYQRDIDSDNMFSRKI